MAHRAIICGGSIGGLFAACALRRAGWHVDVLERTDVELAGRGAGIVTHPELIAALKHVGANVDDLGVEVFERTAFDIDGGVVHQIPYHQIVTSWDRIHQILRAEIPDECHHLGAQVLGYQQDDEGAEVLFNDGRKMRADLVIGADGFRSAIRAQMQPEIQPEYAGYVVWRTLAQEADFPADAYTSVFGTFGMFLPTGRQVLGYPIAGPNNDLRPGHRRYNFVWYAPVPKGDLANMLTDDTGVQHDVSIPPPLVRQAVLNKMEAEAQHNLPKPFRDILAVSERPFFTPIYDHHSPVMVDGRVALCGDAACVARPHVGMGVTKAAEDALSLAHHVSGTDLAEGLARYSAERVAASRVAYDRAQLLGTYLFEPPASGNNADGRNNPKLDQILRLTAVVPESADAT